MSRLNVRTNSRFWHSLGLIFILFAFSAIVSAQKDDKDAGEKKEEHKKPAKEEQKQRNVPRREEKEQAKPSPSSPQATPQTSKEEQKDSGHSKDQNTTEKHQPREFRPNEREKNEAPSGSQQTGKPNNQPSGHDQNRANQVHQERPAPQTPQKDELKRDHIATPERLGNQPREHANTPPPQQKNENHAGPAGRAAQPQIIRYPNGQPHTVRMVDGGIVRRNESGHVVEVRTPGGTVIHHTPAGVRHIEIVRPGGVVISTSHNHGFVQRPVVVANRSFVQRTYVSRGVVYTRVYRPVIFRGITLNVYTPVRYYRPAFYVWAGNPWSRPIVYAWGWGPSPWYGFYGGYFVPYPTYVSPVFWLTDYLISETLQAAYADRMAAAASTSPYTGIARTELTPEVKQLIADEVRYQIDMERAESQNPNYYDATRSMFDDGSRHTFVVSNALLVDSGPRDCTLSEGDVIQTLGIPQADSPIADVAVLASKPMECRKGSVISVQLSDLQEMQNQMRATVEQGLNNLQSRGGQSGLPALPPNLAGATETPLAAQIQPDPEASRELSQAEQEGNEAEKNLIDQSTAVAEQPGGAPATISLGQTIDQVVAMEGQPQKIIDLGNKKIYIYPDIKITFVGGQVTDAQ